MPDPKQKIERLTSKDKKVIFSNAKPKIFVSIFILLIGNIFFLSDVIVKNAGKGHLFNSDTIYYVISSFIAYFLLTIFLNRKAIKDISRGEKYVVLKKVDKKHFKIDYEPGSASLNYPIPDPNLEMKPLESYNLLIDGLLYNVEKELFKSVNEGDIVRFHTSIYSDELLLIEPNS